LEEEAQSKIFTLSYSFRGKSSIVITNYFSRGKWGKSETFECDETLVEKDFKIKSFEVWGFDFI